MKRHKPEGSAPRKQSVTVLSLSNKAEDRSALRHIFNHTNWKLYEASNCCIGLALLRQQGIRVVICDQELPDGTWKTVLEELRDLPARPRLIVSSRLADDQLWGEVLNLGAYDLLAIPFEPAEVCRVAFLAWHSSRHEVQEAAAKARKLMGFARVATAHS